MEELPKVMATKWQGQCLGLVLSRPYPQGIPLWSYFFLIYGFVENHLKRIKCLRLVSELGLGLLEVQVASGW